MVVVVCKVVLVFYFGPNQALGLGLKLGPSRTYTYTICIPYFKYVFQRPPIIIQCNHVMGWGHILKTSADTQQRLWQPLSIVQTWQQGPSISISGNDYLSQL